MSLFDKVMVLVLAVAVMLNGIAICTHLVWHLRRRSDR